MTPDHQPRGPLARAWGRVRDGLWVPDHALNLGVLRISLCLGWLLYVDPALARHFTLYGPALWMPPGVWRSLLPFVELTPAHVDVLAWVFYAAGLLALVGLCTRAALAGMLLAGVPLLFYPQCFGHVSHSHHLLWCGLLLLASPCGDALALDALRRRKHVPPPAPSLAYAIPLRAIVVLMGVAYFFPGLLKLVHVGTYWLTPSNFIGLLHQKWTELPAGARVVHMDAAPWLCAIAASATVAFELLFLPAAVLPTLRKKLGLLLFATGICFHVATYVVMRIVFLHMLACYPAMIDWHALLARIRGAPTSTPALEPRSRHRGLIRVSTALAVVLIAGNIAQGLFNRQDWPLACYPTFAHRAGPTRDMLEFVVVDNNNVERRLTEPMLASYSTPSRVRTLCFVIMSEEAHREARLRALWSVWQELDPSMLYVKSVRADAVTIAIDPAASPRELGRRTLATLVP